MFILNRQKRKIIRKLYNTLSLNNFSGSTIRNIILQNESLFIAITLPENKTSHHLKAIFPIIKEHMDCVDLRIAEQLGHTIIVELAYKELNSIDFNESFLDYNTLKLNIPTAFGKEYIDFYDSASCHMLQGGASRMGKTNFLLFLITTLYTQNKGNINFYISSAKPKDFYPFNNVRNISIASSQEELLEITDQLTIDYNKRLTLINTPQLEKCVDAKTAIKNYPSYKHHFQPIFLVIDEYARYSDNTKIQKKITEIVETMGYLNIHVVISSQRTDARTVLNPRIRANLMCALAFTTKDKSNSELIIGIEGAENLGKIVGRALLSDKDLIMVQTPFMKYETIENMMKPYKEDNINDCKESEINRETKRFKNHKLISKMESMFKESNSGDSISPECEPDKHRNKGDETSYFKWFSESDN